MLSVDFGFCCLQWWWHSSWHADTALSWNESESVFLLSNSTWHLLQSYQLNNSLNSFCQPVKFQMKCLQKWCCCCTDEDLLKVYLWSLDFNDFNLSTTEKNPVFLSIVAELQKEHIWSWSTRVYDSNLGHWTVKFQGTVRFLISLLFTYFHCVEISLEEFMEHSNLLREILSIYGPVYTVQLEKILLVCNILTQTVVGCVRTHCHGTSRQL